MKSTIKDQLDQSVECFLGQTPPYTALEKVILAVNTSTRPPKQVLQWLRSAHGFLQNANELRRLEYWNLELILLCKSLLPESIDFSSEQELVEAIDAWEKQSEKSNSMERAAQAALMAHDCSMFNRDSQGVELLNTAIELSPQLQEQASDAFLAMRSNLCSGAASIAFANKNLSLAAEMNACALTGYDMLQVPDLALMHLARLADILKRDWLTAVKMIFSFISILPGLETRLGPEAVEHTQKICRTALKALVKNHGKDDLIRVMQGLKGARFSLAMYHWDPAISVHSIEREILAEIDSLESRLKHDPIQEVYPADTVYDEQMLLSTPTNELGHLKGGSNDECLINLQKHVDRDLARAIYGFKDYIAPYFLLEGRELRTQLDERTVLVDILWQQDVGETIFWHISVSTSSETRHFVGNYLDKWGKSRSDNNPWINPLAIDVQHLRHRVKLDSGPRMIDSDGALDLEIMYDKIIGDWADYLHCLRDQGKDHLCFVPHGSLHSYPLHLLGKKGSILADDWVVTYLPNICFLRGQTESVKNAPIRSKQLALLGISFAGTAVKPELPQSVSETKSIGNIYGIEPILEDEADSNCLLEAFNQCRYVHLSTHGRHNVTAPAFQSLMMGGGTKVRALDILGQDLRGLELLTLSACETSLGRFDSCDNLTGLPAMLFLSGLQTLIGTMWPVDPDPAETFYTELYKQLHKGRGRLDAFSEAVKVCRKAFPQYRHWGAFSFCGSWIE